MKVNRPKSIGRGGTEAAEAHFFQESEFDPSAYEFDLQEMSSTCSIWVQLSGYELVCTLILQKNNPYPENQTEIEKVEFNSSINEGQTQILMDWTHFLWSKVRTTHLKFAA